ncbi:MAG: hypothetical protein ABI692_02585, partial [Terracoccus sp.]
MTDQHHDGALAQLLETANGGHDRALDITVDQPVDHDADLDHEHSSDGPPRHSAVEYDLGLRNPTADIFVAERPWGEFQQFVSNEQVTVKIITVQPGHRL